jgi:hypothetical protein
MKIKRETTHRERNVVINRSGLGRDLQLRKKGFDEGV